MDALNHCDHSSWYTDRTGTHDRAPGLEDTMARNPDMAHPQIQWPRRLWKEIRKAAIDADISASEFVRRAVREKLKQHEPEVPDAA